MKHGCCRFGTGLGTGQDVSAEDGREFCVGGCRVSGFKIRVLDVIANGIFVDEYCDAKIGTASAFTFGLKERSRAGMVELSVGAGNWNCDRDIASST